MAAISTILIGSLIAAALAGGALGTGGIGMAASGSKANSRNEDLKKTLRDKFGLNETQIEALISQYGDVGAQNLFDFRHWGDQSDEEGLNALMNQINEAYEKFGYQPEAPSEQDLNKIMEDAYAEIDSENNRLLNMYEDTYRDSKDVFNQELLNNAVMFNDYRNQMLTNEAMQQQAIAGATRYELDRQQRNAISRGASAAQRLVTNINTSLGLQAQSAQQALDTSNALAQNLLAQRQAQQGIRSDYIDSRNAYNAQTANTIAGQAERRLNYGRAKRQDAIDKYNYAYDTWNDKINNYFQGNSVGAGIYRAKYGSGSQSRNAI